MPKKRNRGNGSGSIFKRRDDGPYCIAWYDATGKRREHNTLTTDKQAAERILADKLADVALRRDGVIDPRQESLAIQSRRPIEEHLADFEAMMSARQRSEEHVKRTIAFVREVCTAAGFVTPNDIPADGMNRIMAAMKAEGKAPRTIQGRVVAVKAFTVTVHGVKCCKLRGRIVDIHMSMVQKNHQANRLMAKSPCFWRETP